MAKKMDPKELCIFLKNGSMRYMVAEHNGVLTKGMLVAANESDALHTIKTDSRFQGLTVVVAEKLPKGAMQRNFEKAVDDDCLGIWDLKVVDGDTTLAFTPFEWFAEEFKREAESN